MLKGIKTIEEKRKNETTFARNVNFNSLGVCSKPQGDERLRAGIRTVLGVR